MSKLNANVGFTPRKLRVACIGSGFAGLTFIQKWCSDPKYKDVVDLVAYEKNSTVGGVWHENSYPGGAYVPVSFCFLMGSSHNGD